MSPFLTSFTESLLGRLVSTGGVELTPGEGPAAVAFVAKRLGSAGSGESLVSTFVAALLACPHVEEVWADNDTIRDLITDLPVTALER